MKKYIDTFTNMFSKDKDKKTKTQNLIFALILLVFTLIVINSVFKKDTVETLSKNVKENSNKNESTNYNDIETNLKNILNQISGISEVSVMLTYSSQSKMNPIYDVKEDVVVEEDSNGSTSKTSKKTTTEKNVAYEEIEGKKVAIVESTNNPDIIGAIIVAKGVNATDVITRIKEAVAATLNIPVHKVQVFEK